MSKLISQPPQQQFLLDDEVHRHESSTSGTRPWLTHTPALTQGRAEHSHHLDLLLSKAFPRQLLHALEVTHHWSGKDTVQSSFETLNTPEHKALARERHREYLHKPNRSIITVHIKGLLRANTGLWISHVPVVLSKYIEERELRGSVSALVRTPDCVSVSL